MSFNFNKILIITAVIAFGFPSLASADLNCRIAASCDGGETSLLELSATSNAHAGLPGSGYPYKICCSGASGLSSSCSGDAKIIAKLSGTTNAHIRENTELDYSGSNNACMAVSRGTLTVGYQDNDCSGYDITLASLSKSLTNSHIGGADDYPRKICAKYVSPKVTGFLGLGGGGGGGSSNSEPVLSPGENQQSISNFISNLFAESNENINSGSEANIANEDSLPTFVQSNLNPEESNSDNLLTAAAGSFSSRLLDKPGASFVALGAVLGLILVSRKLYLKGKA